MVRDTSSSPDGTAAADASPRAISTRAALLCVLLTTMSVFMAVSLWLIWHQVRGRAEREEETGLAQSIQSFGAAESERYASLQRETALLSELPSLKALLTTDDDRTIQDASVGFWKTSGGVLFALADPNGRVRAIDGPPGADLAMLSRDLSLTLPNENKRYLVSNGRLFHFAATAVNFGDAQHGAQLGTVVDGYEIDEPMLQQLSKTSGTEAALLSGQELISESPRSLLSSAQIEQTRIEPGSFRFAGRNNALGIASVRDLSPAANAPLRIVFQRSLETAEQAAHQISRSLLVLGGWMLLIGSVLMSAVARYLTRPLEALARRVAAFKGASETDRSTSRGTREMVQLENKFAEMELRVSESNRAQLEAERLATIGSMATSVSHDLRHNLATIYAHAEFLVSPGLQEQERDEFFDNIQTAVLDTTEMLESLATFSRTGQAGRLAPERLEHIIARAFTQVQLHPAAAAVKFESASISDELLVHCDAKQVERAVRNLLLNACQARRAERRAPIVSASVQKTEERVQIRICDNGIGVDPSVQRTLFEPFVSVGKQDGTGLGLTLARRIAEDHGGSLTLLSTGDGQTVFELTLRHASRQAELAPQVSEVRV